jgi:SAM-dependent methyltransferase
MSDHEHPKRVVARGYDAIAERYAAWSDGVRQEERRCFARRLIDACPVGAALLELGCGAGGTTTQLLARHFRVTGVDVSPRSLALARRAVPGAAFVAADMTVAGFRPQSFDAVAAFYSIIHVPRADVGALLRDIFAWLRPGGLLVATMSGGDVAGSYERDWLGVPMFWSGHGPEATQAIAEAAGFTVEALTQETADEDGKPVAFWWLVARRPPPPAG